MESILEVLTPDNLIFIFNHPLHPHWNCACCHEKWEKSRFTDYLQHLHRVCT